MKRAFVQGLLVTLVGLLGATHAAQAATYSNMFVFGDSLSDSGNNAALLGFTVPGAAVITGNSVYSQIPYSPAGTYSNGPVWATTVASALGVSAAPSLVGGSNFAFGGAQTSVDGTDGPGGFPFSMTKQVGMFMQATGGHAASDALYVVAGGGNNVRAALEAISALPLTPTYGADIQAIVTSTAAGYGADVAGIVDSLQAVGAQHFLVWNTPDFGLTPSALSQGPAASGLATMLSGAMNQSLAFNLSGEGADVVRFDVFSFLQNTVANANALGLSNVTDACGNVAKACSADIANALFWDAIHPTARGHELLADAVLTTLAVAAVPEPSTYALLAVGLLVLAWRKRAASR